MSPNKWDRFKTARVLLAAKSGDGNAARAHLLAADDSIKAPARYEGWLKQECDEVGVMVEAAP